MKARLSVSLIFLAAILAACGDAEPATQSSAATASEEPSFPPSISPYDPEIDPADFVATIDNKYMPLRPNSTWTYEGTSDGEREVVKISVESETKEILGIPCTIVRDVVLVGGETVEKTFDWFAQDRYGNVWYFGEHSEEWANGKKVGTEGSWEAGVDGAQAGIVMLGDPQVGDRYRQEYYAGEAEDMGEVLTLDESVEVTYSSFDKVLVTKDWNPLESKTVEHKFYAPGVGLVMEQHVTGSKEKLELVNAALKRARG